MRVIVNVDDLGLHPAVQRAVEAGAAAGVVSSASVLANGPCTREALSVTGVGLGAHLNILRGRPLSPPSEIPSLVGPDGLFLGQYGKLLLRHAAGLVNAREVELEWRRQIERLLELGFRLDHADSEKHIHCWPRLMRVACDLAAEFGLPWVRRVSETPDPLRWDAGGRRSWLLWAWSKMHRRRAGVAWPDAVWGMADQGSELDPEAFKRWMGRQRQGLRVVEVCCHPGRRLDTDPPPPAEFGPLRVPRQWAAEDALITGGRWESFFRCRAMKPVAYGDVDPRIMSNNPTEESHSTP